MTPEPTQEQREAAAKVCPCWGDPKTGPESCGSGATCELHASIAEAFAEREASLIAEKNDLSREFVKECDLSQSLGKRVASLIAERDEALGWLRKIKGQPYPDSISHCAAFARGAHVGAVQRADAAERRADALAAALRRLLAACKNVELGPHIFTPGDPASEAAAELGRAERHGANALATAIRAAAKETP